MSGGIALEGPGGRPRLVPGIHSKAISVIGRRLLGAAVSRALMMLSAGLAGPSADGRPNAAQRWRCWSVPSAGLAV